MKLKLNYIRNLLSFGSALNFSSIENVSYSVKNHDQVCKIGIKVNQILKSSFCKFHFQMPHQMADFVANSKTLAGNNSNGNGGGAESTILSETFENFSKHNERSGGSFTAAEIMLSNSSKRKHSAQPPSHQTNEADASSRPFTVSIEGNIGSGKSTFLNHFAAMPAVSTYQEPLAKWTDAGGHNLLKMLYENPRRWSFLFQSYVQLTRLQIHLQKDQNHSVKLIERSLQNNRYCFVESGHASGDLSTKEYDVLCEYFDVLNENLDLNVDLIVYLRTNPEVVHRRMQERGRAEESGVPLAYLQKLHFSYERWLMEGQPCPPPAPVLVIDANSDLLSVTRSINFHQPFILGQEAFPARMKSSEDEEKENKDPKEETSQK